MEYIFEIGNIFLNTNEQHLQIKERKNGLYKCVIIETGEPFWYFESELKNLCSSN